MVQSFQRHASCHGPIADNADDLVSLFQLLTRLDHTKRRGHTSSRVACIERVVDTFLTFGEPAQPSVLSKRVKLLPPPSEELMRIRLIARVPYDLVLGWIEQVVQ